MDPEDVATLVRLGGRRTPVPAGVAERVRLRTERAWRSKVRSRRRRTWAWRGLAAGTLVAGLLGVALLHDVGPVPVARVARVEGEVFAVDAGGGRRRLAEGAELSSEDRVKTLRGRIAMVLEGRSLRLDRNSEVGLSRGAEVRLTRGALFVASDGGPPLVVATRWSRVRELGTRFIVAVDASEWSVTVRDGSVVAETAAGRVVAHAGESLRATGVGPVERGANRAGTWRWTRDIAPPVAIDGRSLRVFLGWVQEEAGWEVAWASPELEARAAHSVLHGSLEDLTLEQALEAVLASCGLRSELDGTRLTLSDLGEPAP